MQHNLIVNLNEPYGLLAVSGNQAMDFLQGQLTCDMRELSSSKSGCGAFCNPKGRIRALLRIFVWQEVYYLQLPRALLPKIASQFQTIARFSKVKVEDVSQAWQRSGVCLLADNTLLENTLLQALELANHPVIKLPLNDTESYSRFELCIPIATPLPLTKIAALSSLANFYLEDFNTWKLLDIRAGIPEVWPETSEAFLPHYLNLPELGAVSFNKGCYCGQEIIARMEYRGNLKRRLLHAVLSNIDTLPAPGTPVWSSKNKETLEKVGTVVTASRASNTTVELLIESGALIDQQISTDHPVNLVVENNQLQIV